MRAHRGTYDVERVGGMTTPVTYGSRAGVGERHVACADGVHLSAEHLHAFDIRVLPFHVCSAHEHLAFHVHQRTHRGRSHAMLPSTCLGDDACLAHPLGQQDLSDGVVDLVCSRVVQVLTFQVEATAVLLAHAACEVKRRRTAYVVAQQSVVFAFERFALDDGQVRLLQILHAFVQDFRHIGSAKLSVEAVGIGKIIGFHNL